MIPNKENLQSIELTQENLNKKFEKQIWYSLEILKDGFAIEREEITGLDECFFRMDKKEVENLYDKIIAILEDPAGDDAPIDLNLNVRAHQTRYIVTLTYDNYEISASADLYDNKKKHIYELIRDCFDTYAKPQSDAQIEKDFHVHVEPDSLDDDPSNKA